MMVDIYAYYYTKVINTKEKKKNEYLKINNAKCEVKEQKKQNDKYFNQRFECHHF